MIAWLELSSERRSQILSTIGQRTQLPEHAIEKDWWVTLTLQALFSTPWADRLVFKGGTSLSKAWNLIDRFSEDIDLAIDRAALGFGEDLNKGDVKRLRRAASTFMNGPFRDALETALLALGLLPHQFRLQVRPTEQPDLDPRVIELYYVSDVEANQYVESRVLIEIGARSLREPCSPRGIVSIVDATLPGQSFSRLPFSVQTVDPKRTFLEKAFLLHEFFYQSPVIKPPDRQTRHLFDLEKLMGTTHADDAFNDPDLYHSIIHHREKLTPVRGITYDRHTPDKIDFIPPVDKLHEWETDYVAMQQMIHGPALPFRQLIARLKVLRWRFRRLQPPPLPFNTSVQDVINQAVKQITDTTMASGKPDGTSIQMLVHYNLDIYKPANSMNVDRVYRVSFTIADGQLVADDCQLLPGP